jgi:hypothetical protein
MTAMSNLWNLRPARRARILLAIAALALATAGCLDLDGDEVVLVPADVTPPGVPSGLRSITGDGEVQLSWNPNLEEDLAGYKVYWSPAPAGPYELMATAAIPRDGDRDVDNGRTYFYAVTAFDDSGNESELSPELIQDTPRPAGCNLVLYSATGSSWELSGYDFGSYVRRPWSSVDADIYFAVSGGRRAMVRRNAATDLQDAGYAELDDLDWAPPAGWTDEDRVTLLEGHAYYVWTSDDHFAKFRVTVLDGERVVIDWAYQIDKSNPELVRGKGR